MQKHSADRQGAIVYWAEWFAIPHTRRHACGVICCVCGLLERVRGKEQCHDAAGAQTIPIQLWLYCGNSRTAVSNAHGRACQMHLRSGGCRVVAITECDTRSAQNSAWINKHTPRITTGAWLRFW